MRKILGHNSPVLRKKSKQVAKVTKEIQDLVGEMLEIMKVAKPKGIGLAAPQIGELLRIVVINFGEGDMAFINPEIVFAEGECVYKEGCLSVPGLYADIKRAQKVKFKCLNVKGKPVSGSAEGVLARVLLHEIDHLEGKLFIDYLEPGQEIELDDETVLPKDLEQKLLKGGKK